MDYIKIEDGHYMYCEEADAEFAVVPISEYRGFKKAVEIVNNRSLLQIDKSKTDKNGFRFLRADRKYSRELNGFLYLITKETSYSSKIDLATACFLIENRLRELYYWTDMIDLQDYSEKQLKEYNRKIQASTLPRICEQWEDADHRKKYDFLDNNSDAGRALFNCWQENSAMIYKISKISVNYAQGLYEVSYWATEAF